MLMLHVSSFKMLSATYSLLQRWAKILIIISWPSPRSGAPYSAQTSN